MAKMKKSNDDIARISLLAAADSVDPALASLFKASTKSIEYHRQHGTASGHNPSIELNPIALAKGGDEGKEFSQAARDTQKVYLPEYGAIQASKILTDDLQHAEVQGRHRKRKRKNADEDIEEIYLRRQEKNEAREEEKQQVERGKHRAIASSWDCSAGGSLRLKNGDSCSDGSTRVIGRSAGSGTESMYQDISSNDTDDVGSDISINSQTSGGQHKVLEHESLAHSKESLALDKSSRTVFLANISTLAITVKSAKKALIRHLSSFLPSLPPSRTEHKLKSFRFRSIAFTNSAVPKRAAFARKELMDATTKSTNAYAVYSTALAAREAVKRLNGTLVLDRHLRVDSVAHPAKTDHRRCVFVGNLGFVDDESLMNASEGADSNKTPSKPKAPSDIEEGLWRQFENAGRVENVRVIRDQQTRVGKGIAYVQFMDPNSVEAALLFNDKKYPPLLPRKLRVTRAKNIRKVSATAKPKTLKPSSAPSNSTRIYNPKVTSQVRSLQGRANKLLGRAGAAQFKALDDATQDVQQDSRKVMKTPESIVFEGYRATSRKGKGGVELGGSGKKKGKPRSRSSKRGTAWKLSGGKKGK